MGGSVLIDKEKTLFGVANMMWQKKYYEHALMIYEYLKGKYPGFQWYELNYSYLKNELSQSSKVYDRYLIKSGTDYQHLLHIADVLSKFRNPDLIDICFKCLECSADGQVYLPKAVSVLKISHALWLEYFNNYLDSCGILPMALRNEKGRGADSKLFYELKAQKLKPVDGPLVTICMSCYNAENFVEQSVQSLLDQSYRNLEIFLVNDKSTDNTLSILNLLKKKDSRITVIDNKINKGTYVSRNIVFQKAKGDFFTILDADDYALPERVATQVDFLIKNQQVIAAITEWIRMEENGDFHFKNGWGGWYQHEAVATMMFRTEPVRTELGYWDSVRFGADTEYMRRLKKVYGDDSVVTLKKPTVISLLHDESLTRDPITGINVGGFKGLSPVRRKYRDLWQQWHEQEKNGLYVDFPLKKRLFNAPQEML